MKRIILTTLLVMAAAGANATLTIRELWDSVGAGTTSLGLATRGDGVTSLGFQSNSVWQVHPSVISNALIQVDQNFDPNPGLGLPVNRGNPGINAGLWSDVFWGPGDSLAGIPFNSPSNWCARSLATSAQIDFSQNGVYYFSLAERQAGGGGGGIAIASGLDLTNTFVGFGMIWPSYPVLDSNLVQIADVGNSLYICQGTFGDPADTNTTIPEAQGLYAVKSAGLTNLLVGNNVYLLVGELTVAGGNATLKVKAFTANDGIGQTGVATNIPLTAAAVTWDATYTFTDTNVMKYLVVFMNTMSPSFPYNEQGALRVATTWGEVVGVEAFNRGVIPTNVIFGGQSATFTNRIRLTNANTNNNPSGEIGWQYRFNGAPIIAAGASGVNAQNISYTIASATTNDTGDYDVVVTNAYGTTITPAVHLTVLPSASPSFLVQPGPALSTRYAGGYVNYSAQIQGTPPIALQWFRDGTSLPGQTGLTLSVTNLQTANSGGYYLRASNFLGLTFSVTNSVVVLTPGNSYLAAVFANGPFAHYELNESSNSVSGGTIVIHDSAGGNHGICLDPANVEFGLAGPPFVGFEATDFGVGTSRNAPAGSRVDLPIDQYNSSMTLCGWVFGAGMNNGIMFGADGTGFGIGADGSQYFGLYFPAGNTVGKHWGPTGTSFNSGLVVPDNQWTFVSLVISPTESTIYVGQDPANLAAATETGISNITSTVNLNPMCLGRTDYSWAGPGNAWAGCFGSFSQMSVYYQSLSPSAITNLFVAGVGVQIRGVSDGIGNLSLTWLLGGTLQEATNVAGPYIDVTGALPPHTVPMTDAQKYYRVKR